jgi:predicted nucleotidyltransferase
MTKPERSLFPFPPNRVYFGANVPRRVIRSYARAIAAEFHPEKIILFGSYAYGAPHEESDVDLLVVMRTADPHGAAVRIQYRLTPPFPVDLVVRTPEQLAWPLAQGESFLRTVVSQGKVLYEGSGCPEPRARRRGRAGPGERTPGRPEGGW